MASSDIIKNFLASRETAPATVSAASPQPGVMPQAQAVSGAPAASPSVASAPAPQATTSPLIANFLASRASQLPASQPPAVPGATPDNPLDVSPVDITDRLKLSVGNASGSLQYLKHKFDDVKYVKDKGLVVNDRGTWKQVDPEGMGGGSAWDKTKEVVKDFADLGDVGINFGVNGAAAAATGATGGAAVGLMGAAGAASGAIRTSLGRLAGTYDATPEEQAKDIGLEALFNAGGQAIGAAAKPTLSKLGSALTNFAGKASDGAKSAMAGLLSATADLKPENAKLLMTNAPEIMGELRSVAKTDAIPGQVMNMAQNLRQKSMGYASNLLQDAGRALGSKFDAAEKQVLAAVPSTFKSDPGKLAANAMAQLEEQGLVQKIIPAGSVAADADATKLIGQGPAMYKLADRGAIMEMLKSEHGNGALNEKVFQNLAKFVSTANSVANVGEKTGADAVEHLINVRRGFDKFYYTATRANPEMKQLLTPASATLRNDLVAAIHSAGDDVATKYAGMNKLYTDMMPHVAEADRIMRRGSKGVETFVKQLTSGDSVSAINLANTVAGLKDEAGQAANSSLKYANAAQDFISKFPQVGLKKLGAAGGAMLGAKVAGGMASTALGAAAVPLTAMSSPRLVGNVASGAQNVGRAVSSAAADALPYLQHFGDTLKSMAPEQMKALISHPQALPLMIQEAAEAVAKQKSDTNHLLQSHGVTGPGQQGQ